MNQDRKFQVTALLKAIETGAPEPVAVIDPAKYIQHNLAVGDGLAGFAAALKALPPGSAKVNTVRVCQDGDFVFAHTEYDFFGPKIGFDIFRFENGRIVAIGHPHRAAEHHQDLAHGLGAGERISLVQTADTPAPAPFRHQIRQGSRPHQLLVLEEHHLGNAGGGHRIRDIPISIERSVPTWRS